MSQGTLYTKEKSPRSQLPVALIEKFGLDVKIVESANVDETFEKSFPMKLYPAFIGAKGQKIHEVMAISYYLINLIEDEKVKAQFLGANADEQAQIMKWFSFVNTDMGNSLFPLFLSLAGIFPYNKKACDTYAEKLDKIAGVFEARLKEYTYVATEKLSLADLFAAICFRFAFTTVFGQQWRDAHPAIVRWYSTIKASDFLKKLTAADVLAAEPLKYTPPKKEKKEQPKQEKKAEKKAEKKEESVEDAPVQEKKPKHPLAALEKATFVLDDWKRKYSNEDTRPVALPWFWEHYKPEEYSLWKVAYKYNDELTLKFMSNNLIGGFFNRLSASVKYMFGCMVVYGEDNNNGIIGVIMVRGQEFLPAFDVAPDWESYDYTKLDPSSEADREFVNDLWAWDKPIVVDGEPKEIADGKVLK